MGTGSQDMGPKTRVASSLLKGAPHAARHENQSPFWRLFIVLILVAILAQLRPTGEKARIPLRLDPDCTQSARLEAEHLSPRLADHRRPSWRAGLDEQKYISTVPPQAVHHSAALLRSGKLAQGVGGNDKIVSLMLLRASQAREMRHDTLRRHRCGQVLAAAAEDVRKGSPRGHRLDSDGLRQRAGPLRAHSQRSGARPRAKVKQPRRVEGGSPQRQLKGERGIQRKVKPGYQRAHLREHPAQDGIGARQAGGGVGCHLQSGSAAEQRSLPPHAPRAPSKPEEAPPSPPRSRTPSAAQRATVLEWCPAPR